MIEIETGQRYTREDGARLRVDIVRGGVVYYVTWRPGHLQGSMRRTPVNYLRRLIEHEGLTLIEPDHKPDQAPPGPGSISQPSENPTDSEG